MENYEDFVKRRHAIIASWPVTSTFTPAIIISAVYYFVSLKLGPKFMDNRKPYQIKPLLTIYNLIQVIFNVWMVWRMNPFKLAPYLLQSCCSPPDLVYEKTLIEVSWWWCINKILDLADTGFMILRKKYSQINLLHLYHHPTTLLFSIMQINYGPGVLYLFPQYLNCLVHIIMYFYYFMSNLGPEYEKYLWWKKYLTSIQIVQFVTFVAYVTWAYMNCSTAPTRLLLLYLANSVVLLTFFAQFYLQTYKKKKRVA